MLRLFAFTLCGLSGTGQSLPFDGTESLARSVGGGGWKGEDYTVWELQLQACTPHSLVLFSLKCVWALPGSGSSERSLVSSVLSLLHVKTSLLPLCTRCTVYRYKQSLTSQSRNYVIATLYTFLTSTAQKKSRLHIFYSRSVPSYLWLIS